MFIWRKTSRIQKLPMTPMSTMAVHRLELLHNKPVGQLLVHEIYQSIQGESTFAGLPCVFVRLAVCDARCRWCDTPHAFHQGSVKTLPQIVQQVLAYRCRQVEITGGEPLLQEEVLPLMTQLADQDLIVLLETSGAHAIDRVDPRVQIIMDLKCPDSGECAGNYWPNLDCLKPTDQIKFVIATRRDFDWAAHTIREHKLDRRWTVLLSPAFEQLPPVDLVNWLLASGLNVRIQLQMHKHIWHPKARGV